MNFKEERLLVVRIQISNDILTLPKEGNIEGGWS